MCRGVHACELFMCVGAGKGELQLILFCMLKVIRGVSFLIITGLWFLVPKFLACSLLQLSSHNYLGMELKSVVQKFPFCKPN